MEKLIKIIEKDNPDNWLLSFEGDGEVTLEYFGEGYCGDKECGSGSTQYTGKPGWVTQMAVGLISANT